MGHKQLNVLLEHIYGPYPAEMILHPDFPRPGGKIAVQEFQLYDNSPGKRHILGLDDTEYITSPPVGSPMAAKPQPQIVFFGVVEIETLDWLSEQGRTFIKRDIAEYNREIHVEGYHSRLVLEEMYSIRKPDDNLLQIRLFFRKTLLAHFLTSNNNPEKLLVYAQFEQKKRICWIQSIHAATYARSRKFIDRWRLSALLKELIDTDPNHTPLEDRTIDWAVERYLQTIVPRDREDRLIGDLASNANSPTSSTRLPRHVSRAEIRGYFAAHADWLLANLISRKQGAANLLDIHKWILFCRQAHQDSVDAHHHGVRWGVAHGEEVDINSPYNLARRLAKFGETEEFWGKQLEVIKNRRKSLKTKPASVHLEVNAINQPEEPVTIPGRTDKAFHYDSDFSGSSCSSDVELFASSDSEDAMTPEQSIPTFCLHPPSIPSGRFIWHCPGCAHQIDFLKLSEEDTKGLPPELVKSLNSKRWRIGEERVRLVLYWMVNNHYMKTHIRPSGITFVRKGAKWRIVQNETKKQSDDALNQVDIKTE